MAKPELSGELVDKVGELVERLGLDLDQDFKLMSAEELADWQRRYDLIRKSYFRAEPGGERMKNFIEAEKRLFSEAGAYMLTWDLGETLLLTDLLKRATVLPMAEEFKKFGDQILPLAAAHARAAKKIGVETPRLVLRWIRYNNGTEEGGWWLSVDLAEYSVFSDYGQADQFVMALMGELGLEG